MYALKMFLDVKGGRCSGEESFGRKKVGLLYSSATEVMLKILDSLRRCESSDIKGLSIHREIVNLVTPAGLGFIKKM